jgi:hypothetical protein
MKKNLKLAMGSATAMAAVFSGALLLSPASASGAMLPTGTTWDCLVGGSQGVGVAYITFNEDSSVEGFSIMKPNTPKIVPPPEDDDNVRGGEDSSRTSTGSSSPGGGSTNTSSANVYGSLPIRGTWGTNEYGKPIGFFTQVLQITGDTNTTYKTNLIGFKATVTATRLTLVAYTPNNGRSTYSGRRFDFDVLPDMTGKWYGAQTGTGQQLYEFFEVAPAGLVGAYNILNGEGATYSFFGDMIISKQGRIGTAVLVDGKLRATVGTYSKRTRKALTTGILEPGTRVRYNAYHYPDVIPTF